MTRFRHWSRWALVAVVLAAAGTIALWDDAALATLRRRVSYLLRPNGSVHRITQPLVFSSPDQVRDAVAHALTSAG